MKKLLKFLASPQFLAFAFGGLLAAVLLSVVALAQTPAAPMAPELNPILKLGLTWALPLVVPALSGAIIYGIVHGILILKSYVDAHVKDNNFRNALDHILDTASVVAQHVEQNERPNLTQAAGDLLATGKLTPQGAQKLENAALVALKSDAGTMLRTVQDSLGLSEAALNDFLKRKLSNAVAHMPPSVPAAAAA